MLGVVSVDLGRQWHNCSVIGRSCGQTTVLGGTPECISCYVTSQARSQDFFFLGGGGCVVWRGRGIFARIFFFFWGGGVRSLERKGYFCQRFSVAVKSIYNQLRHDNSLLL